MLVFVNKIENLNNQETVKSSYFTSIGGILFKYYSGVVFKYYLQLWNNLALRWFLLAFLQKSEFNKTPVCQLFCPKFLNSTNYM